MGRRIALAAVLLVGVACSSESDSSSSDVVTKHVPVASFTRIAVDGAFNVTVTNDIKERVTLKVPEDVLQNVDVSASDGTLHIRLKEGTTSTATMHVDVSLVNLFEISARGASRVHVTDEFTGLGLELNADGAVQLDVSVQYDLVEAHLTGTSSMTLAGIARNLEVSASGANQLDAQDLQVDDLKVRLSGATTAVVSVSDTISATLSGASLLRYSGSPTFTKKDIGVGSSITKA